MLSDGRFTGIGVKGLRFERRWTRPGVHPYEEIAWETRTASIGNEKGVTVFEQKDVEVPAFWSQLAPTSSSASTSAAISARPSARPPSAS